MIGLVLTEPNRDFKLSLYCAKNGEKGNVENGNGDTETATQIRCGCPKIASHLITPVLFLRVLNIQTEFLGFFNFDCSLGFCLHLFVIGGSGLKLGSFFLQFRGSLLRFGL